ncbi:MAG: M23 family metallopeptidase [Armatimonadota bacterium]|nr:M23 family metallopeptidase [Armatimonadota bacterium]MDR7499890.1 M23 family metallopeptidase [Armatimonadota bacterium]
MLLLQPTYPVPSGAASGPEPFLDQARAEARLTRLLAPVQQLPVTISVSSILPTSPPVSVTPAPEGGPEQQVTVTVREGQSLWSLAETYGTSVEAIMEANGLEGTLLRTGQRLVIPTGGTLVTAEPVKKVPARKTSAALRPGTRIVTIRLYQGQTLWDVARAYGTTVEEIADLNGLDSPDRVQAGQQLRIPARGMVSTPPRRTAQALAESAASVASSAVALAQGFVWPARGRLTSRFGWRRWRHHDGIDIAAPYGAPVTAARDGIVIYAGWYHAYGKAVILDHGSGLQTLYGHTSALLVRTGQRVEKGQLIARVGSTGRSTGPHLHFEVRINGRPVNPIKYL